MLQIAGELFHRNGYHGTGVDEIGEVAGISGPALYRHFANKQAVLDAICVEGMTRLLDGIREVAAVDGDPSDRLHRLIDARIDFAFGSDRHSFVLYKSELQNLSEQARRRIAAQEELYRAEWLRVLAFLRGDAPTSELQTGLQAVHHLIGYVTIQDHLEDPAQLRAQLARMVYAALLA